MLSKSILHRANKEGIKESEVYEAYKIFFGTLVSESRLKIINLLRSGKKNVSEIISNLDAEQTRVSHDLARLKKCGFVKAKREGPFVYYELNSQTLSPLMDLIDKHMASNCIHILHHTKAKARGHKHGE